MVGEANIYGEVVSAELTLVSVCAVFRCVQSWITHKGYILPEGSSGVPPCCSVRLFSRVGLLLRYANMMTVDNF